MRFFAYTLPDLVPLLGDVELVGTTLSRSAGATGSVEAKLPRASAFEEIRVEGTDRSVPLMRESGTLLIAWDGSTARSFIVRHVDPDGEDVDVMRIQGFGHGSIPDGFPYRGSSKSYVQEDPLNIVRHLWRHITSYSRMISVEVSGTSSPVRVGEEEEYQEGFERSDGTSVEGFHHGPHKLNWWDTTDISKEISDLVESTPFEWRERTEFNPKRGDDSPRFFIDLAYPKFSPREPSNLHFEIGYNVIAPEQGDDQEYEYTDDVFVLGSGSGSETRRGNEVIPDADRLRTPRVIEESSIDSMGAAASRAKKSLRRSQDADRFFATVTVLPSPAARSFRYDVGDIITIKGKTVWGKVRQRSRIVDMTHTVETDTMKLTLERA